MSRLDLNELDLEALSKLSDARYYDWHQRYLRPEYDRRLAELNSLNASAGGRALLGLRVISECLTRDVRERISIFEAVAREKSCWAMFSTARLDDLRQRVLRSVDISIASLISRTKRAANAVGVPESALPNEKRYEDLRAEILTTVNIALAKLEAEGLVAIDFSDGQVAPSNSDAIQGSEMLAEKPAAPARVTRDRQKPHPDRDAFISPLLEKRNRSASGAAMEAGIDPASLSRWRSGKRRLAPENIGKLADYLKVPTKSIPNS